MSLLFFIDSRRGDGSQFFYEQGLHVFPVKCIAEDLPNCFNLDVTNVVISGTEVLCNRFVAAMTNVCQMFCETS